MILHLIRIAVITGLIVLAIFYPFIPGEYDAFAISLSTMAQLLGMSALLLFPIGLLWLLYQLRHRGSRHGRYAHNTYRFSLAALIASCIVAMATSLGAFISYNISVAIITLVLCAYVISNIFRRLKQRKNFQRKALNPAPFYLVFIPVLVVLTRFTFIIPATEYSRSKAIRESEELIKDIEAYHIKNGHYPASLLSVWEDYKPSVVGIKRYHYELNGTAYNLYFEQFSHELSVREIVMYNKLDEHEMTSHNQDLLRLTPESLNMQRGYFAVYDLPDKHWKYFWFD